LATPFAPDGYTIPDKGCSSFQCTQITDICNHITDSSSCNMELSGLFSTFVQN
jgi:hypothetical protein